MRSGMPAAGGGRLPHACYLAPDYSQVRTHLHHAHISDLVLDIECHHLCCCSEPCLGTGTRQSRGTALASCASSASVVAAVVFVVVSAAVAVLVAGRRSSVCTSVMAAVGSVVETEIHSAGAYHAEYFHSGSPYSMVDYCYVHLF